MAEKPVVAVIMGSDSDLPVMTETINILKEFGIPFEVEVSSAHRSPDRTTDYFRSARDRGLKVLICGAGAAFHLAGVAASHTTLPVIAVPLSQATALGGLDALYAAVQMPGGIPVGVMSLDKAGAKNAGLYAAEILGTHDPAIAEKLADYKKKLAEGVAAKSAKVKQQFGS
jgi:phosphoribosylaminoimidazole carboxylase PurE protein